MKRDSSGRFLPREEQQRRMQQQSRPWMQSQSDDAECAGRSKLSTAGAVLGLLGGAAAGAAAMYLLDPEHGQERREAALDATNRALETATDAVSGAYETTTDALGNVWHRVTDGASDLTSAAAASIPSARKTGRRWFRSARNYGSDALDSARSYLPTFRQQRGFSGTTTGITAVGALALGLGAMWLLDPERGRGRRAWIVQKATRLVNETGDFMRATGRHLRNKTAGYAHDVRTMLPGEGIADDSDDTISDRIRSELGRLGIAGTIGVRSEAGRITLSGRCATDDVDRILVVVRGVRGVSGIDNQLGVGERFPSQATSNMSA